MNNISFGLDAWQDYIYWQQKDKKILKKINTLLRDIQRNGYDGIGKPEALKGTLNGFYSRRIDDEHRLVYKIVDNIIHIASCKGHY